MIGTGCKFYVFTQNDDDCVSLISTQQFFSYIGTDSLWLRLPKADDGIYKGGNNGKER